MVSQQERIIKEQNESITMGIEAARNYLDLLMRIELQLLDKGVSESWNEYDIRGS